MFAVLFEKASVAVPDSTNSVPTDGAGLEIYCVPFHFAYCTLTPSVIEYSLVVSAGEFGENIGVPSSVVTGNVTGIGTPVTVTSSSIATTDCAIHSPDVASNTHVPITVPVAKPFDVLT
jgi:hypothetical protein